MSVLLTLGIIGGGILVLGGGAVALAYDSTKDERARARIAEIDSQIANCNTVINALNDLKIKVNKGKDYLNDAKNDFSNGGHVFDDVPLCDSEFVSCLSKLTTSSKNIDNLISKLNEQISSLKNERKECEKDL